MPAPKVEVVPFALLPPELKQRWEALRSSRADLNNPCYSVAFAEAVARVRSDLYVAVMLGADGVHGFLPFHRNRLGMAKCMGAEMSDFNGAIAAVGEEWDAGDVCRHAGVGYLEFYHMPESQQAFSGYVRSRHNAHHMDLSAGYPAYRDAVRAAGSRYILDTENLARRLEREHGLLRFEACSSSEAVLDRLLEWKSLQYKDSGLVDVLSVAWVRDLVMGVFRQQGDGCRGVLSGLYAGDVLVAAHLGMRSASVMNYGMPAYAPEFGRYSPGTQLLLRIAEWAAGEGIRRIELGKGDALYKRRLGNGVSMLCEGEIALPGLATAARRSINWCRRALRGLRMT